MLGGGGGGAMMLVAMEVPEASAGAVDPTGATGDITVDASTTHLAKAHAASSACLADNLARGEPLTKKDGWCEEKTVPASPWICNSLSTSTSAPPYSESVSTLPAFHKNSGGFTFVALNTCVCLATASAAYSLAASCMNSSATGFPCAFSNSSLIFTLLLSKVGKHSNWSKSSATALRLLTRTVPPSLASPSPLMRKSVEPYMSFTSSSQRATAYVCSKMHRDLSLNMILPPGSFCVALLYTSRARFVRGPHSEDGG